MIFLLLVAVVALGVALQRQARRIDAIKGQLADLLARGAATPHVEPEPIRAPPPVARLASRTAPPPPAVEPLPEPEPAREAAAPEPTAAGGFERLVGGRLPIWVGGAALAVAGYFLVRLAIESGLLGPWVRVALAALFGVVLLAAGEAAARLPRLRDDVRVGQALAGAGIATLYAALYLAGAGYGLIDPFAAFVLLAAVTAAALALALKRGPPVAVMALAGGFATPLLAGGEEHKVVPLLAYLALLCGGLLWLSVRRGWLWLALAAAAGGLGWSGLLIATARDADALAAGLFTVALALAATFALGPDRRGRRAAILRLLPIAAAAAELVMLIGVRGFDAAAWGLYLLLSAAAIFLAARDPRLTPGAAAALALSLIALAGTAAAGAAPATPAGAGIALLFGCAGYTLARRQRDGGRWAAIGAAALNGPLVILWSMRAEPLSYDGWAAAALLLAVPPAHLAWRSRHAARTEPPFDVPLAIGGAAAAALVAQALAGFLPWTMGATALLVPALLLAEVGRRIGDGALARLALAGALLALAPMLRAGRGLLEALAASLSGERVLLPLLPAPAAALRGLLLPAPLLAAVAWRAALPGATTRRLLLVAAAAVAAGGLYELWKQLFAIRDGAGFVAAGFLERALLTQALFAAGWVASRRSPTGGRILTIAAAARLLGLDLVLFDPAFVAQQVGALPLANLLVLHFAAACVWIGVAWSAAAPGRVRTAWLAALVAAAAGGAALTVRQAFHGALPAVGTVGRAEFYGYSVAGVLLAVELLGGGAAARDRPMRVAGLGLLTLMVLKVFLVDAAALAGLLRVASFLGLGAALIAIGWGYGRLLGKPERPQAG